MLYNFQVCLWNPELWLSFNKKLLSSTFLGVVLLVISCRRSSKLYVFWVRDETLFQRLWLFKIKLTESSIKPAQQTLFSQARTHSFFALDCIPCEVDLWHFSLSKCPLWYESLNVKVPFHFLFVFSQHPLIASLILKPEHLLTCFEVQTCRNWKMTRCQTNKQGLACVTWQFCWARKQIKVGKGTRFIFSRGFPVQQCAWQNRHASQANKDYFLCPVSAPPMEKRNTEKFRKVTLQHHSLPSPKQLPRAWPEALSFTKGCWRRERRAGKGWRERAQIVGEE